MASGMSVILAVAVLSLTTGCSRRMTCALEGCTKNGSVILATDFQSEEQASQDADAIAHDNSALEKEIAEIKARMVLNDAAANLVDQTLALHEKRIAALETKAQDMDSALKDLQERVPALEDDLSMVLDQIAALEVQINGSEGDEATPGLMQELAALKDKQQSMQNKLQKLRLRVKSLESFRENQLRWNSRFNERMDRLFGKVRDLKDRLRDVKSDLLDVIQDEVDGLISKINTVNDKVSSLQGRVTDIEEAMLTSEDIEGMATVDDLESLQGNLEADIDGLTTRMTAVETAASASECEVSAKYRDGLFWYRDLTCDGIKLKILAL